MARRWLDQVDAMRPVKQAGVLSTHSILYFAPAAATVGSPAVHRPHAAGKSAQGPQKPRKFHTAA